MTERKPEGLSWQSWIDRQIREGQLGGAFDDLDGHGRPIDDIGNVHDELWWIKAKLRSEDIEYLPPTIAIRAQRAAAVDAAMESASETTARVIITDVNTRIRYINSHGAGGPPSTTVAIDVGEFIERWRAAHPEVQDVSNRVDVSNHDAAKRDRWWRRLTLWWRSSVSP